MKAYLVVRYYSDQNLSDYAAVVISEDEVSAEKYARSHIDGWREANLRRPIEIDMNREQAVLRT